MNIALQQAASVLLEHKLTIAFAESATAGRIAAEFSLLEGAGQFLRGGIVCYSPKLKEDLLSVPYDLIQTYTAESLEVTHAITVGLRKLISADIYMGITGLISPGGSETPEKPVGTMFIHGSNNHDRPIFSKRIVFKGSAEEIVLQTVEYVAQLLQNHLKEIHKLNTRNE